jgi:hypothetical protein
MVNKRSVIEEELEILYDAYYYELESFAHDQAKMALPEKGKLNSQLTLDRRPRRCGQ